MWRGVCVLTRDIDGQSNPIVWKGLAIANGISEEKAFATTVASMKGAIFEKHVPNGKTKWLLRLGIFHRSRRLFGQQFCPHCLSSDAVPYYRLQWRFAFSTVCTIHKNMLLDRCQACGHSVEFHRTDPDKQTIVQCFNCQRRLDRQSTERASTSLLQLQEYLDSARKNRHTLFSSQADYTSVDLFAIYSQLLRIVSTGSRSQRLRDVLASLYGFDPAPVKFRTEAREYESLNLRSRAHLATMCAPLLLEWPDRFIDACRRAEFWATWASKDAHRMPSEYTRIVEKHLDGSSFLSSRHRKKMKSFDARALPKLKKNSQTNMITIFEALS